MKTLLSAVLLFLSVTCFSQFTPPDGFTFHKSDMYGSYSKGSLKIYPVNKTFQGFDVASKSMMEISTYLVQQFSNPFKYQDGYFWALFKKNGRFNYALAYNGDVFIVSSDKNNKEFQNLTVWAVQYVKAHYTPFDFQN